MKNKTFWYHVLLALIITTILSGCNSDDVEEFFEEFSEEEVSDNGDFVVVAQNSQYDQSLDEIFEQPFTDLASILNDGLKLPKGNIVISFEDCGEANAFYAPNNVRIIMCYELFIEFFYFFNEIDKAIKAYLFVFFHELGHALTDQLDLAILGREEVAVDGMATVIMVESDMPEAAILAGYFFNELQNQQQKIQWFDSHSVGPQRMGDLVCWAIGGKPEFLLHNPELMGLAQQIIVLGERNCEREYEQQKFATDELLKPYEK